MKGIQIPLKSNTADLDKKTKQKNPQIYIFLLGILRPRHIKKGEVLTPDTSGGNVLTSPAGEAVVTGRSLTTKTSPYT